jgi:hypothetical protein
MRRRPALLPYSERETWNKSPSLQATASRDRLTLLQEEDRLAAQCSHSPMVEMLIPDARAGLTPSQQVEGRVRGLLQRAALPHRLQSQ